MTDDKLFVSVAKVSSKKASAFTFYLGGSRRMEQRYNALYDFNQCISDPPSFVIQTSVDTDYDFYATYSPELEAFLLNDGFDYSVANEYYLDTECVSILVKDNVQVVLRTVAEFYNRVFENIDLEFYHDHLWKSSPVRPDRSKIGPIFDMLFKIAHATKGV